MSEHEVNQNNANSLAALVWAIRASQGKFSLILARCNSTTVRSQIVQQLRDNSPVKWREVVLDQSVKRLFATLKVQLGDEQPSALMVFGLEALFNLDSVLTAANQVREEFRKQFSFPIVWWVTDDVLRQLMQLAPDLESWTKTIRFSSSPEQLIQLIQQTANQIFSQVLETGAGKLLSNVALNLGKGSPLRAELKSAYQELQHQGITLTPELEANWQFILGRIADGVSDESQQHYEQSLALWQHCLSGNSDDPESEKQTTVSPDISSRTQYINQRLGCVLYSVGIGWRTYAVRHRAEYEMACDRAKGYFQQCVAVFEQCQQPELVAKFINALGEILQRLKQWDELAALAEKALELHQTHSEPFRLARVYGFLAEVALAKSDWSEAQTLAQNALTLVQSYLESSSDSPSTGDVDWVRFYDQGWYHFALARAQRGLGQNAKAIDQLETARKQTQPHYEPELYIQILQALRDTYFQDGQYLKAFDIKQKQREIEQRYGFRAFIGAGRLQPKQEAISSSLLPGETKETIIQEIAASGRQQDVQRLVERLGRIDHKLTVIYGQSGVGKSSIVQAGLIPVLQGEAIGIRDVLPILLQVYTDWRQELGQCFTESLKAVRAIHFTEPLDTTAVIEELKKNGERNLLTVLIFDQFEEFFFVYKDTQQRLPFYEFLRDCLDIPYVKVILSLREDYLHYLLEFNRLTMLEVINNNILDKLIIYYLGNFSPADTKSVIQSLTAQSQFFLEEALIDELVSDLAGHLGEVRPIELQVVGAQLQTEKITTLEQYRENGPKEALVGRFLEEVVQDCGSENEQIAKLVLYLLTDENNTRPLKTRADLELELDVKLETLTLVLDVLVKSGLVLRVPASPADRYQLVHDYLVPFVRQQQSARLVAELEKEREQRKLTEAKLNQVLKRQLRKAIMAGMAMTVLAALAGVFGLQATISRTNAELSELSTLAESLFEQNKELDALTKGLRAAKKLESFFWKDSDTTMKVLAKLQQIIYGMREINRLEGHNDTVTSVRFSPNDKKIVSTSADKTIKLWNSSDGSLIKTLEGHQDIVTSASFSPNGEIIASTSVDKTIKLWNSSDGKLIKPLEGHNNGIVSATFSPNGEIIASISKDGNLKLWQYNDSNIEPINIADIGQFEFSADGKKIITLNKFNDRVNHRIIKIWSINGTLIREEKVYIGIDFEKDWDSKFVFTTDKKYAFFGNGDSVEIVSIQNIINGPNSINSITKLKAHVSKVTALSFTSDGKILASASQDKTIKLWTVGADVLKDIKTTEIKSVFVSPNGQRIAEIIQDNSINILQINSTTNKVLHGYSESVSWSPDENFIASASMDERIQLWRRDHRRNYTLRKTIDLPNIKRNTIEFSPDYQLFIALSIDNKLKLWRRDGTFIKTIAKLGDDVSSIRFSPDSQIIASFHKKGIIKMWNHDGIQIAEIEEKSDNEITSFDFSPDGKLIFYPALDEYGVYNGSNKNLKFFSVAGKFLYEFKGNDDFYNYMRFHFSPNEKTIGIISFDKTIKLWNPEKNRVTTFQDINNLFVGMSLSPDGQFIAGASINGSVVLWNRDGKRLRTLNNDVPVLDVRFSPDSQILALVGLGKTVKLWNRNGTLLNILEHEAMIDDVVNFGANGQMLTKSEDGVIKLWSQDGKFLQTFNTSDGSEINFSSDGNSIFSISSDRKDMEVWSNDGTLATSFDLESGSIITVSPDGQEILSDNGDPVVKIWKGDGTVYKHLKGHEEKINSVSFSPDGKMLASASDDKTVKLWKIDGTLYKTLKGHEEKVNSFSFSPDGKMLASASDDKTVKLWKIDGTLYKTLDQHIKSVNSVTFSQDSKTIASASDDNTVKLWKRDGTFITTLQGHDNSVNSVSFSPNGNLIASADSNTVYLWNRDGKLINKYRSFGKRSVSFSPNGKTIIAASDSGTLIWSLDLDNLLKRGCDWARDYLKNNPKIPKSDRTLCDGIGTPK
ncbi:nSTAND1 domain-containing NTPase [Coleofasciculus chthonoplastes]|uniref:nSTAND1 domain-containing NTPase n=1 Tax=Coleofasciculus chthonoplastes TaxID=64178 RepID=UPI0032F4EA0D